MKGVRLSLILPTLEEGDLALECVQRLAPFRAAGHELILVDGGSRALPADRLASAVDQLIVTSPGRAVQMNRGAGVAQGEIFWFLHVDSQIPADAEQAIIRALVSAPGWGRFDVRLSGSHPLLRLVERLMNWRSRCSGIATGDQGIFVHRSLFEQVGGYPEQELMEDIELSRRLKRISRPHALRERLITSSRRWEREGILRTILLMWGLRLAYRLGISPSRLAARY